MTYFLISISSSILSLSLIANILFYIRLKKKPKKEHSLELQAFLGDLLSGGALVAVSRIDPSNILLRSPRAK